MRIRSWNGSEWLDLPSPLGSGEAAIEGRREMAMASDSAGNPYIAYTEETRTGSRVRVKRWNGVAWDLLGQVRGAWVLGSASIAGSPSLAVNASGDALVAWQEIMASGESSIWLRRFAAR
jgi:hypothetical protein